ncbi:MULTISPECIES: phosphoribosylanthranilate isomerase [Nitrincola]|uniref:N-(5'-phosphoribosyl)anthranilate isomerase n=1 Tax=Nitrincola nitratireducens TaxID=1229521 RepID=W9URT9_9GAMM|nr:MULTISPECIES: phosphoribosylanthranilate isomerase [Nitrincola]EXJ09943.1 N-(5'-phosphoribosyl)anthranilate isomerase [Nitrincola nitratireducens]
MRARVKICGITNLDDALASVSAGADALGFVFYKPSPRYIEPNAAADIIKQLPAFVTSVGLFVNETHSEIERIVDLTQIDLLQFHGDEPPLFCQGFSRPSIKALRVSNDMDLVREVEVYADAVKGVLLDTYVAGVPGGTGAQFDWGLIPDGLADKIILAGGLDPNNVAEAVLCIKPYAVDVSGGVEKAKGFKDISKVQRFIHEVTRVSMR